MIVIHNKEDQFVLILSYPHVNNNIIRKAEGLAAAAGQRKAKAACQPRQALEEKSEKSGFDFWGFFEATRGASRCSWTEKSGAD
ncbi:hypothetical protein [Metabacillus sp. RGM 3146]|uniref:hypothetical protein n=1 Tax=Metabacillus sp. RGM 3146 TaxID=3401092 RepID=UPI003B9907FA